MYHSIEHMLEMIDEPNRSACRRLHEKHLTLFEQTPGSSHNHQAWTGGYIDHLTECMNFAVRMYRMLGFQRSLPFTLSDALTVLYLHDLEKPWKYETAPDGTQDIRASLQGTAAQALFRRKLLNEFGIVLSEAQQNAFDFIEGENSVHDSTRRLMQPLAAFCHIIDVTSARIWFDHPLEQNEPWRGAKRFRKGNRP